jgi:transcriptional regulator with XRE-family HTH domain
MSKNSPHPVDVHVGARIRQQRTLLGMSQSKLAETAKITFQQVQKYEKGSNRVSASMMWKFAKALQVPVATFFEGLPEEPAKRQFVKDPMASREVLELARHYTAVKKPSARLAIRELAKSLAA